MAKFRPPRGKNKPSAVPSGGLPCVILVIGGMFLVMLLLYWLMRSANG